VADPGGTEATARKIAAKAVDRFLTGSSFTDSGGTQIADAVFAALNAAGYLVVGRGDFADHLDAILEAIGRADIAGADIVDDYAEVGR
jgi:hypothetical protein